MTPEHYPFQNHPLPYAYNALEPNIDTRTMQLHHDKHLQTYIDNLNAALKDQPKLQELTLQELILGADRLPKELRLPIARNAGGVYNHQFFFEGMSPEGGKPVFGKLVRAIIEAFGGVEQFLQELKKAALSVFGSGYAWLVSDKRGRLHIVTTANQETPLPQGECPILNLDVWEHAYYLKNQNRRAEYIDSFLPLIDWKRAEQRYEDCTGHR